MSSHARPQPGDYSPYWEQSDAEAHALATLFPDWPGREEELPDWLHPAQDHAVTPPLPAPTPPKQIVPASPQSTMPVKTHPIPMTSPLSQPPQPARDHLYSPKPQITTPSPYLKPLAHQSDSTAVWTHIPLQDLPFTVQAIITLSAIPAHWSPRGFSHRHAWVAIQLLQGGFSMVLDDGEKTHSLSLYSTDHLLILPPVLWRRFVNVLDDTLLLCVSSHPVAESLASDSEPEWITQYAEFLTLRHSVTVQ